MGAEAVTGLAIWPLALADHLVAVLQKVGSQRFVALQRKGTPTRTPHGVGERGFSDPLATP